MIPMTWMAANTVVMMNNMRKQQEENKKKCQRCAELSGCWKGQNGGNPDYCSRFSPKNQERDRVHRPVGDRALLDFHYTTSPTNLSREK